ncbi:MAG: 4-hydroxythreonine-4-phosphate dehydrogenase PdxA [Gammaproteobacteria bacterium]|nr:4-hydroxythreonine-4-phosphate dehydrogenase PdxA [Gammaproteobacteria bacterium]
MIVVTPGEPAGIGPDLVLMLCSQEKQIPWLVIGDLKMLSERAQTLGLNIRFNQSVEQPTTQTGSLTVIPEPLAVPVMPGVLDVANVPGVLASLDQAIEGCMSGRFTALVTGPVQKSIVIDAGIEFTGHTEYLCSVSGADDVVMLLVAGNLRVALATTHLPLRDVSANLTSSLLLRRLKIFHAGLRQQFAIDRPRILVAGLNPHAGESGHLGDEEIKTITPVCEQLRANGIDVVGPLPADTIFTQQRLANAHGVFVMYHDQGLPVLKYAGFGEAVNVTLGLPFVRTSVDHGTALDIAGSGAADTGSLAAAISLAASLAS